MIRKPIGIWIGAAANILAFASGAVFFFAQPGDRFRGMEPEAALSSCLGLSAAALGLFFGLPISLWDIFSRRFRLWGFIGVLIALTPLPLSNFVSDLAAESIGFTFD